MPEGRGRRNSCPRSFSSAPTARTRPALKRSFRGHKERAGTPSRLIEKEDGGRDARGPPSGPQGRTRLFLPPPPLKADQAPSSHCQHRAPSAKRSMVVLHLLSPWVRAGRESRARGETVQYIASCPIVPVRQNDDWGDRDPAGSLTACSAAPGARSGGRATEGGRRSIGIPGGKDRSGAGPVRPTYRKSARSFPRISSTTPEGREQIFSALRARQSRLSAWSARTAPWTGRSSGRGTSNG